MTKIKHKLVAGAYPGGFWGSTPLKKFLATPLISRITSKVNQNLPKITNLKTTFKNIKNFSRNSHKNLHKEQN